MLLTLICLASALPAHAAPPVPSWQTEAIATAIVVGTVRVEMGALAAAEKRGGDNVTVRIAVSEVLKGPPAQELQFRFYAVAPEQVQYPVNPSVGQMRALDGKKRIVYLVRVDDPDVREAQGLWLANGADGTTILEATTELVSAVRGQVERHQRWLKEPLPPADPRMQKEVNALVEELVATRERQARALERLEALGKPAIVAMVHAMDDRRKLAAPQITLRNNSKNAFEATRHYGPKLVVDALAALLNQVTSAHFGTIYNGGSEAERAHCVGGWKLYVRHLADR